VPAKAAADVMAVLAKQGETVLPIGSLTRRQGDGVTFSGTLSA